MNTNGNDLSLAISLGTFALGWVLTRGDSFPSRIFRITASIVLLNLGIQGMLSGNEVNMRSGQGIVNEDAFAFGGLQSLASLGMLAFIWGARFSGVGVNLFLAMVDPEDTRDWDPHADDQAMDKLADLARQGKNRQAIRLARKLKKQGRHSVLALETMIARIETAGTQISPDVRLKA